MRRLAGSCLGSVLVTSVALAGQARAESSSYVVEHNDPTDLGVLRGAIGVHHGGSGWSQFGAHAFLSLTPIPFVELHAAGAIAFFHGNGFRQLDVGLSPHTAPHISIRPHEHTFHYRATGDPVRHHETVVFKEQASALTMGFDFGFLVQQNDLPTTYTYEGSPGAPLLETIRSAYGGVRFTGGSNWAFRSTHIRDGRVAFGSFLAFAVHAIRALSFEVPAVYSGGLRVSAPSAEARWGARAILEGVFARPGGIGLALRGECGVFPFARYSDARITFVCMTGFGIGAAL